MAGLGEDIVWSWISISPIFKVLVLVLVLVYERISVVALRVLYLRIQQRFCFMEFQTVFLSWAVLYGLHCDDIW